MIDEQKSHIYRQLLAKAKKKKAKAERALVEYEGLIELYEKNLEQALSDNSKHVPTTWVAERDSVWTGENLDSLVCTCYQFATKTSDSKLIAAAPDLLEALKDLLFIADIPIFRRAHPDSLQKARAAIAKATQ
jgi:hypothetical protein